MNKENASKLWKMIQEAGDYLRGLSNTLTHTHLRYSALVMPTIYISLKINRIETRLKYLTN